MENLKNERNLREYQIELEKTKAEIISLQSQINPHFLYNTLEVIRSEAILNKDMVAAEMAEALANYFRYNISKRKELVTLGEELDNINNYIMIQKKRFGERIQYKIRYYSEMDEARCAVIPKLTLQPLVENAIYHGIEKRAKGGTVQMNITVTQKRLIVIVEDDGPGMKQEELDLLDVQVNNNKINTKLNHNDRHGGIALTNINQRIKMIFGKEYGLSFSSTLDIGTEVEVTIPYITDKGALE